MEPVLSTPGQTSRVFALGCLVVAALLAHWLAFSGLRWAWPVEYEPPRASTLEIRMIAAQSRPLPTAREHDSPTPTTPMLKRTAVQPTQRRAPSSVPVPVPTMTRVTAAATTPTTPIAPSARSTPTADRTVTAPRYTTMLAQPVTLHYELTRGAQHGEGELIWRPTGDRYEASFELKIDGATLIAQRSEGSLDAFGIAPVRFTDQRARRGTRATNFQSDVGTITFSGPSLALPRPDGVQDRLSWMLQLAGVVAAQASHREVGAQVVLPVVGVGADLGLWVFVCAGAELLTIDGVDTQLLRFVREPDGPYDVHVDVWLDPQRQYLPVRSRQKSGSGDAGVELTLRSLHTPFGVTTYSGGE